MKQHIPWLSYKLFKQEYTRKQYHKWLVIASKEKRNRKHLVDKLCSKHPLKNRTRIYKLVNRNPIQAVFSINHHPLLVYKGWSHIFMIGPTRTDKGVGSLLPRANSTTFASIFGPKTKPATIQTQDSQIRNN